MLWGIRPESCCVCYAVSSWENFWVKEESKRVAVILKLAFLPFSFAVPLQVFEKWKNYSWQQPHTEYSTLLYKHYSYAMYDFFFLFFQFLCISFPFPICLLVPIVVERSFKFFAVYGEILYRIPIHPTAHASVDASRWTSGKTANGNSWRGSSKERKSIRRRFP